MYCEKCGTPVEQGGQFCQKCGAKTEGPAAVAQKIKDFFKKRNYDAIPDAIKLIENEAEFAVFALKAKGDVAFVNGNYTDAETLYDKIPDALREWDTVFNLALINLNKNKPADAIGFLESVRDKKISIEKSHIYSERYKNSDKAMVDIYLYLGALYKSAGNNTSALKAFESALKLDPDSELVNANIGDVYFKEDSYDEAIKYYKKAISVSVDYFKKSYLHNDLGLAYFRKGLFEEAIESFKSAIIQNPANTNAVYNLGTIYVRSGMQEKVKEDYREFLSHEGGVDIVFNLSRSIMEAAKQELASGAELGFIGEDASMAAVKEIVMKAAATDSTVFIQGENGTGKELAARAIHQLSVRAEKPFIVVNCGALPENLLESELFGYEKGAFTGAVRDKAGRFELADRGTVFLDEIGDITPAMQVKLLRFVQNREFERVGGTATKKVDVRIIAATNANIKKLVETGRFREDLYYRLYVLPIYMPPLRVRGNDIKILASHFLNAFAVKYNKKFNKVSREVGEIFNTYQWPGNVRQLENVIERIVTLYDDYEVKMEHLPEELFSAREKTGAAEGANEEKERVIKALKAVNYSRIKAAKMLGISRVALWKKMKKMGIS
jgi:transcriptional regulator with PAS, ATPase and Fis domain